MKPKIEKFLAAYGKLVQEYGVDFAPFPELVPDGTGSFKISCRNVAIDLDEYKKQNEDFVSKT